MLPTFSRSFWVFLRKVRGISRSMHSWFLYSVFASVNVSHVTKRSQAHGLMKTLPFLGSLLVNGPVTLQSSVARNELIECAGLSISRPLWRYIRSLILLSAFPFLRRVDLKRLPSFTFTFTLRCAEIWTLGAFGLTSLTKDGTQKHRLFQ